MNETPDTLMQAAAEAARVCGRIALSRYRRSITIESKADGSPVTEADRDAERAAREWIESRFPEDGILGEEFGLTRPEAQRRWLIDPIDGTKTFVRGVPLWGSLVAVIDGERVVAGAASFPALDEEIAAGVGAGSFANGAACRVSAIASIEEAAVLVTSERFAGERGLHDAWLRLAGAAALSRTWGDCYGYLLVATGRAEVMVDPAMSPWDAAALLVIVEEAGGVFTDWSGQHTAFGGNAIATNAFVAAEARRLLASVDGDGGPRA
jgi:histidinol phosphatase-like enzyme (inositol monophosphatase family)